LSDNILGETLKSTIFINNEPQVSIRYIINNIYEIQIIINIIYNNINYIKTFNFYININ